MPIRYLDEPKTEAPKIRYLDESPQAPGTTVRYLDDAKPATPSIKYLDKAAPEVAAPDTFRPGAGGAAQPADAWAAAGVPGQVVAPAPQAAGAAPIAANTAAGQVQGPGAARGGVVLAPPGGIEINDEPFTSRDQTQYADSDTPQVNDLRELTRATQPGTVPVANEAIAPELVQAVPRVFYRGGSNIITAADPSVAFGDKTTEQAVAEQRERDQLAADSGLLPPRSRLPGVQMIEDVGVVAIETAPLVAPLAIPSRVAGAATAASRYLGAAPRVAGAIGGAAGASAGITEFNVASGVMNQARGGEEGAAEGLTRLPESLARLAPGGDSPELEDYVNAVLILAGGAWGGFNAPKGGLPAPRAPGQEAPRGGTSLSPEAQRFVDNLPEQNLASWEAKMGRRAAEGNDGAAAMRDAIRMRMAGTSGSPSTVVPEGGASPTSSIAPAATKTPSTPIPEPKTVVPTTSPIAPLTPGGVPGSSKPFQAIPTASTLPVEQPPAPTPVQTPPTAPAPQTGGKPIQETAPLPPHMVELMKKAKAYDDQGKTTITDVTPAGYGPSESAVDTPDSRMTATPIEQAEAVKLQSRINEARTMLRGRKPNDPLRAGEERSLANLKKKLAAIKSKMPPEPQSADDIEAQRPSKTALPPATTPPPSGIGPAAEAAPPKAVDRPVEKPTPPKKVTRYSKPDIDDKLTKAMGTVEGTSKREQFAMTMEARSAAARAGESNMEEATDVTTPAMFSEAYKELNSRQKRAVKMLGVVVSDDVAQSQIEMAGERLYDDAIAEMLQGGDVESRLDAFAGRVSKNPGMFDEETRLMAYLRSKWSSLTLEQRNAKQEIVNPQELPTGTKVTIRGESFEVVREGGETTLRDGIDLNVDNVNAVPIDKGSVTEPAVNKTSGQQLGLLGDKTAGGITGSKSGSLFETRPSTSKATEEDAAFRAKQTPKDKETAEMFEEPMKVSRDGGRIRVTGPEDVLKKIESEGEGFVRKGNTLTGFGGDSPKGKKNNAVVDKYTKTGEAGTIDPGTRFDPADVKENEGGAIPIETLANIAGGIAKAAGETANFISGQMINPLRGRVAGEVVVRAIDDIEASTASLVGKIANDATDAVRGLKAADRKWLQQLDADGHSNFQRMMEDVGSGQIAPPNPRLQAMHDAYRKMMDVTGDEAIARGIEKINAQGDVVPFAKAPGGRFLRHFTPDASEAMFYRGGPTYEAMAREIARLNPGVTVKQAREYMDEYLGPEAVRHVGAIEDVRRIKDIPSSVEINPGKGDWVPILETDPLPAIMSAARSQAQRIYFGSRFGQGLKGEPTKIDRLRAQFAAQGGNVRAFDDVITVFHRRPYKRVFRNSRHWMNRSLRVLNQMISVGQTSMSALPNIPQTLQTIETVGLRAWAKGMMKIIRHPRMSSAQFAAMGATHRSIMEWTVQKGQRPEDITRIVTGLATRANLTHYLAQFNNLVASAQGEALANHWQRHGFKEKDLPLLKDLRLNPREIATVRAGKMTPKIKNKIVQNQVKLTQFINEDPQRKSMFQNIPVLNQLAAYSGYSIGTAKKVTRRVNEFAKAVASGDAGAMSAATKRIVAMLVGMIGAGAVTIMLKNARDGKPVLPESPEEMKTMMTDALWESAILGPTQRVYDAGRYSRDGADYIVALFPKLRFLGDMIMAVSGKGLKKADQEKPFFDQLPLRAEEMMKRIKRNVPLWKWLDPEEKSNRPTPSSPSAPKSPPVPK